VANSNPQAAKELMATVDPALLDSLFALFDSMLLYAKVDKKGEVDDL
jgi:hypothetical protein